VALLTKILNQLAYFSPAVITDEEIEPYKRDFDILCNLGVFQKVSDPQHIWCKTCQNESVEVHYVKKGRAFTLCTQDEYAERDYFDPQTLKQWRFDTPLSISLFLKSLGVKQSSPTENITGLLWDLGTQKVNGVDYHLFFCRNIDEIEKPKISIITNLPHSVVFYTGIPHISLPEKVLLIPIVDFIQKITNRGFLLNKELVKQFFPQGVYATKDGAIELDKGFVLQDNYILFEPLRGGIFKKQSGKLRPLASHIINHLYGIRKYQKNSKTLDELAEALGSTKVSISNEIGRIEKISADNNLQDILHKYSGDKWGINPQLRCCK